MKLKINKIKIAVRGEKDILSISNISKIIVYPAEKIISLENLSLYPHSSLKIYYEEMNDISIPGQLLLNTSEIIYIKISY